MPRLPGIPQMRPEPQPLLVNKQTAAEWQINCAIRNIFLGECPISNHLVVMSAREILDQYARAKGITLAASLEHIILPEYLSEAKAFWKERYNYLKHSDTDPDAVVDFTNVQIHNENDTFMNIHKYRQLFGSITQHMHTFSLYTMARYPRWFDMDALNMPQANKDFILDMTTKKRRELCEMLSETLEKVHGATSERRKAKRLSFAENVPVGEAKKNQDGKYFVRS